MAAVLDSDVFRSVQPFVAGGIAGITATTCVQPIDFVKTQLQLAGEGTRSGRREGGVAFASRMLREKGASAGLRAMYAGYSAAVMRQVVYGSARLGLFRVFSEELRAMNGGAPLPVWQKAAAGLSAGGVSSFIGNPFDLSLVRMQADASLPAAQRRGYTSVVDALARIVREEGVLAMWSGSSPTILRAMALNMAMLATADQAKEMLAPYLGGHASASNLVVSSVISGVAASVASLPFDMVKTRLQKMTRNADGSMPYKGFVDCTVKIATSEGPLAFYKGLGTYMVRIAPHTIITLVTLDLINAAIARLRGRGAPATS